MSYNVRQATQSEIRNHFKDNGHLIRISRDGHVIFKRNGEGRWLEGRWISEYRFCEDYGVICF